MIWYVDLKFKEKLLNEILDLEELLWIPMHRITKEELDEMTFEHLAMYHNKLILVRDNPV